MDNLLQSALESIALCIGWVIGLGIAYLCFLAWLFIKECTEYYCNKLKNK